MHDFCAVSNVTYLKELLVSMCVQRERVCPSLLHCLGIQLFCRSLNICSTQVQELWLRYEQLGTVGT